MAIKLFDKPYRSCSNLFVKTLENKEYVFPAPIELYGSIENESKETKNLITVKFNSYYDSILILNNYFDLFCYLLDFEYKINTVYIKNLLKIESNQDMYGYKGIYGFTDGNTLMNISEEDIYDDYTKETCV